MHFAQGKSIELIGGDKLLEIVKEAQSIPHSNVSEMVDSNESKSPTTNHSVCPKGGGKLIEQKTKRGTKASNVFIGCTGFPRCRYTSDL